MKSMTGYGCVSAVTPYFRAIISAKSLNNRYLDINLSLPSYLTGIESKIRELITSIVIHGKIELSIRFQEIHVNPVISIDHDMARTVVKALRELKRTTGISKNPELSDLIAFEGILNFDRNIDMEKIGKELFPFIKKCMILLDEERKRDGEATKNDIERLLESMRSHLGIIENHSVEIEEFIKNELRNKLFDFAGDKLDESRILTEIASYLAKHTINEEIVRIKSYLDSFVSTIDEKASGKKLDFFCQELNREINTIGSKNMLTTIGKCVVSLKDDLENIREQLRNIE